MTVPKARASAVFFWASNCFCGCDIRVIITNSIIAMIDDTNGHSQDACCQVCDYAKLNYYCSNKFANTSYSIPIFRRFYGSASKIIREIKISRKTKWPQVKKFRPRWHWNTRTTHWNVWKHVKADFKPRQRQLFKVQKLNLSEFFKMKDGADFAVANNRKYTTQNTFDSAKSKKIASQRV